MKNIKLLSSGEVKKFLLNLRYPKIYIFKWEIEETESFLLDVCFTSGLKINLLIEMGLVHCTITVFHSESKVVFLFPNWMDPTVLCVHSST